MTEPNIGDFEKAVVRCEELRKALLKSVQLIGFRTLEEFEDYYLPEYCKKYPIRMRVTKEEKKLIQHMRGNMIKEVKR